MDILMAHLMTVIAASVGAKVPVEKFMPDWRPAPQIDPTDIWAAYERGELGDVS